jgi:hypothetical protein
MQGSRFCQLMFMCSSHWSSCGPAGTCSFQKRCFCSCNHDASSMGTAVPPAQCRHVFCACTVAKFLVSLIVNSSALLALNCIQMAESTFCWQAHELLAAANVLLLGKLLLLWFCTRRRDVPG